MASMFTELAIDCADPKRLARFWCSVLDYEVKDQGDGTVTIGSPVMFEGRDRLGPVPPTLTFARVPEGKVVKNRVHLDVNPTDREQGEEVRRSSILALDMPTLAKVMKAGSSLPIRRETSSASLRAAAPDQSRASVPEEPGQAQRRHRGALQQRLGTARPDSGLLR